MTEILHHLSTCHSTLSLGVRGCKLCISKSKVLEVAQDFFHPPKKEKDFLYVWSWKFLPVTSYFQRIKSIIGSSHCSPNVLHSSPAHSRAQGKLSSMTAAARYTANYTQHYTQHYRQHYRNAARGSISGQDRKIDLYSHFIIHPASRHRRFFLVRDRG